MEDAARAGGSGEASPPSSCPSRPVRSEELPGVWERRVETLIGELPGLSQLQVSMPEGDVRLERLTEEGDASRASATR